METQEALTISREGDVAIACFKSACICDTDEIARASAALRRHIETQRPSGLIFDFTGVKFFSSQVLGLLLETRAALASYDGQVLISSINPQLHRVFKITNLDQVFKFFPDTESAVNAPRSDPSVKSG